MRDLTQIERKNLNKEEQEELKKCLFELTSARITWHTAKQKFNERYIKRNPSEYVQDAYFDALSDLVCARYNVKEAKKAHKRREYRILQQRIAIAQPKINLMRLTVVNYEQDKINGHICDIEKIQEKHKGLIKKQNPVVVSDKLIRI